jgi:hypothetical protein
MKTVCYDTKATMFLLHAATERCNAIRPHFQEDIDLHLIDGLQSRATKLISDLNDKRCEDRLHILNLTTLETRRLKDDIIELFKIFKGFSNLDP